ncbi:MAG TPA: 2-phospho-L-lactate guanylyltransferase [Anaerolineales bacterium]|nr:2-phospho-L-lactate guanylyltransferase [Anaerolineales bacterium]
MTLWAIVPVKPMTKGKSRLAGSLTPEERLALNRQMLDHLLSVLVGVPEIERTLVVSRDPAVLALARDRGARTLSERSPSELNRALERATGAAQAYGASGVLILPADLPLLLRKDVDHLVALATTPPVVVISPDRHEEGTNALLVAPIGLIEYGFGANSFQRHLKRAEAAGAWLEVARLPRLALDVDQPEDLALVREAQRGRPV